MVPARLRGAHARAGPGLAGDRDRQPHADLRPDRLRQDARGVPLRPRPVRRQTHARADAARLRLAAEGALLRRREEPPRAPERHRGRPERRDPHRRHAAEGAARHGQAPAGRADHDAGVAVPDAHEPGAGDLRGHGDRDPGRDPRGRADQARGAPGADAGAARGAGRPRDPARRAVGHAEPAGRGGAVHGRAAAQGDGRGHRGAQAARPEDPRAGRVDGRARADGPGARSVRRPGGDAQVDLARDLSRAAQARQGAPLDADLRQQPPRGGTAGAQTQRARRRAAGQSPPRQPRPRGAADRRGAAQGRRAAVPGGHEQPRARHRHGRRGPRAAGRVAEVGHRRAAADRPRRPQRRRHVEGPHLPEVPGRPAGVRGGRPAHARGQDRDDCRAAQSAGRARPADRGDGRDRRGRAARRRPARRDARAHVHVRGAEPSPARERAGHAGRPLPVRGVRRAAAADRVGPRERDDPRAQGLARARDHERRHDPGPRAVLREPAGRPPRRRAGRGDGLRGAPRPGLPARRLDRGGSRRSRATA